MIRVELYRRNQGVVIVEPTWWERILLRRPESERFVERVPTLPSGSHEWLYDNGRPVSADVKEALEDEVRRVEWERIWERQGGR